MKIQTQAKLNHLRMAPRKARLLIDLIRGMKAIDAKAQLQFSNKLAAEPVLKLLNSAIANASFNHNMDINTLVIKTAFVDQGKTLHRWQPKAMGRATPIRRKTSHITIVLEGEAREKAKKVNKTENTEKVDSADEKKENVEDTKVKTKKIVKKVSKTKKTLKKDNIKKEN